MPESLKTFFVRHTHKLDIDDDFRERLWREGYVAVHYPHDNSPESRHSDSRSVNPADYSGRGKSAIKYINLLANNGGYVCADYHRETHALVGWVEPNAKVELLEGCWGSANEQDGRKAILKAVKLSKVREVSPAACAPIFAARPRQGTIMYWHKAGSAIQRIVDEIDSPITVADLNPDHQEVLCSEYLRQCGLPENLPTMSALLMPIGRTLKDVDIVGVTKSGETIFAQVTYSKLDQINHKMTSLEKHRGEDYILIMFCGEKEHKTVNGVTIIPLTFVFDWMKSCSWSETWLKRNFDVKSSKR